MTVRWVTRAQSGLAAPDHSRLSPRTDPIVGVTKHHTAGETPRTPLDSLRIWREIQSSAMSGANVNHTRYGDIEYNAGFDNFGQVLVGRDNGVVGAHATSTSNVANRLTLGIAFIGSGDPTADALHALAAYVFVVAYSITHHTPLDFAHRDWARYGGIVTDCPGDVLAHSRP
jgi:hypothetical protein